MRDLLLYRGDFYLEILTRNSAHKLSKVRMVGEGTNEVIHISEAFTRAEDLGLDLILISMDSQPPVVRIQDFKKLEYEKKKARKSIKPASALKEIQFKVNISDHDLKTKIDKIQEFLDRGDKVKILVRLKGREKETPERAHQLVDRVIQAVDCKPNKVPGPIPIAILEPAKTAKDKKSAAQSAAVAKKTTQDEPVFSTASK